MNLKIRIRVNERKHESGMERREVSTIISLKAKACQSRLDAERETSAVLRMDDFAVLRPNIGAEYQRPSAFLLHFIHVELTSFLGSCDQRSIALEVVARSRQATKNPQCGTEGVSFLHGRWRADRNGFCAEWR